MAPLDPISPTPPFAGGEPRALLQAMIETAPDGLVAIDVDGRIRIFNPAAERLFGYTAAEVIGENVKLLMPSPYRERHDDYLGRYLATGERRVIGIGRAVVGRRKSGRTFPLELSIGEARFGEQRLFTGFMRDLTETEQTRRRIHELQAELLQVSKMSAMGELASGLAHELNQPLTAVMNYLQASRRLLADAGPERVGRVLELIDKALAQTSRGGQIIHRLRRFITAGESERRPEPINQLVEEANGLALVGAADRQIEVQLDLAADLPPVLVDKVQIHQVLINLIRNAIDALSAAPEREIVIQTSARGEGEVEVAIFDSGPGLAAEVRERLFQPFVTTKPDGMGIGLSICRTIIDHHGGQLWAEPNQGGGTVFRFTLQTADRP
jgi:two-component system sensor kinase FixL